MPATAQTTLIPETEGPTQTFHNILQQLAQDAPSLREKGNRFERLVKAFLEQDKTQAQRFRQVWLWQDWPGRQGQADHGIDLVAEERDTGKNIAIQCKFYHPEARISQGDIATFLAACNTEDFASGILVSTTQRWTANAEQALLGLKSPVQRWGPEIFDKSSIDWSQFTLDDPEQLTQLPAKTPRPHQEKAKADVLAGFRERDRGKLIMACGSGKTYTALQIAEAQVAMGGIILFLAPSITLIAQSLREWGNDAAGPMNFHPVCSDAKVARASKEYDLGESAPYDLICPATTDPQALAANVAFSRRPHRRTVIFSTYQSLDVVIAAQKNYNLGPIDLAICDEAHRTTGVTLADNNESEFQKIHRDENLRVRRRLYMTATPRIYNPESHSRASQAKAILASMDDENLYGPEFHRLSFADAVEQELLCDYRVLIFGVNENAIAPKTTQALNKSDVEKTLDDTARMVAAWTALTKRKSPFEDFAGDPEPMKRVVAFANTIQQSQAFAASFGDTINEYTAENGLTAPSQYITDHVDGTQNAMIRAQKLEWLRQDGPQDEGHILSNARCLSEGIDVPALDGVLFLSPRASHIEVLQAVGRAMRKAPGKKYGYIILPIVINPKEDHKKALKSGRYKVTWQVLQALKAHDEDFYDALNQSDLKTPGSKVIIQIFDDEALRAPRANGAAPVNTENQIPLPIEQAEEIKNAVYARIIDSLTDKHYYKHWAKDVSRINDQHQARIHGLLENPSPELKQEFTNFLQSLQRDLNQDLTKDHAVSMLSQHLITKPIFDALFKEYSFTAANPVSQAMDRMTAHLEIREGAAAETKGLDSFYKNVQRRIRYVERAEDKQRIIADLYEDFFKEALPKESASLGIVYTPVEAVDWILRAVEAVLQQEFQTGFSAEGVHILDPFAGTGTFLQRLIASDLIKPEDLVRKYTQELHANEFMLLAYYIAAINIETTWHERAQAQGYTPFNGIVLTDTFDSAKYRATAPFDDFTKKNSKRLRRQQEQDIQAIIGNPPWSIGQSSQNDDNKNQVYPQLWKRIEETYAKESNAGTKKSLYDTYIQGIRWASDRILDSADGGIIAFITNGGFIASTGGDGLRKTLLKEFHSIYCFNLRGDQRTAGEKSLQEGGKLFGSSSRASVALLILVKKPGKSPGAVLHYHDIGDYLNREQKLNILAESNLNTIPWKILTPNEHGDWINQRSTGYQKLFPLFGKEGIFTLNSLGLVTNRDAWCYNFSKPKLNENTRSTIEFFNSQIPTSNPKIDPTKFSWTHNTLMAAKQGKTLKHNPEKIVPSAYRAFCRQNAYFDRQLNERMCRQEYIHPSPEAENFSIVLSEKDKNSPLSCLMTNILPNLSTLGATSKCLPRYRFAPKENSGLDSNAPLERISNINPDALAQFQSRYESEAITEDDLFYYVYGTLHSPQYKKTFANDLKLEQARLPLAATLADFQAFAQAGRQLAEIHLNYEAADLYPLEEEHTQQWKGEFDPESYRLCKRMTYGGKQSNLDRTTIKYNAGLTLKGIPEEVHRYRLGSRSALDWILDRYEVKKDEPSGIINDPNDWCAEIGDPKYILNLIKRIVTVSLETMKIVDNLPLLDLTPYTNPPAEE